MENPQKDIHTLSNLYPQLDILTSEEKQQVIDYLTKSLATDTTTTQKEVDQKAIDLLGTISESHEHRENITANDIRVYIHGNPMGHQTSGEIEDKRQDPLLQQGYFGRYYTYRVEKTQVFAKNLGNGSIEYTIQQPSLEVGHRSGGYIGFTFILKNGFTIKDTGDIPEGNYQRNYAPNDPVWSVMKSFMDQVLIKDIGLATVIQGDLLKRQMNDKSLIQKMVLRLKSDFISAMNDIEDNRGFLIKK